MVQPQMLGRARRYVARHERRRAEPHHYDISPSAEKVWFVLGLKGLECCSVLVSIVLPKPTLMIIQLYRFILFHSNPNLTLTLSYP